MNATIVYAQGINTNRLGGWLALNAAIPNIERGAVKWACQTINPQSSSFELRHRVRALVFDGEEFALGVTDQNVVAGYLKGFATTFRDIRDLSQISKNAVIHWNGNRSTR